MAAEQSFDAAQNGFEHWAQGYIHEDIDNRELTRWGWKPPADLTELQASRTEFIKMHNQGVERFQHYYLELKRNEGDRPAISQVRQHMRQDMKFVEAHSAIYRMVKGRTDWVSSVLRAEACTAERNFELLLEEIRHAKEEEERREREEVEHISGFGIF